MPGTFSNARALIAAALASTFAAGCRTDLDAPKKTANRSDAPAPAAAPEAPAATSETLELTDARPTIYWTPEANPWGATPVVDADTVSRLGLSSNALTFEDTNVARAINDMRYAGFGEAMPLEALRTVATRIVTRAPLSYASLAAALDAERAASGAPFFKLVAPTGDKLQDYCRASNACVIGTTTDGANTKVIAGTCSSCHTAIAPKVFTDGSTRLIVQSFSPAQPARGHAVKTVANTLSAIDAMLATGTVAGDSAQVRALYAGLKEMRLRMRSDDCKGLTIAGKWYCSDTDAANLEAVASARHLIDLGYGGALTIVALAANLGYPQHNPDKIAWTDALLATNSQTVGASTLWLGGSRAGVTNVVGRVQPVNIPRRPARHPAPSVGGTGWWQPDMAFSLRYMTMDAGVMTGPQLDNYLFGATYLRAPAIDAGSISATALALGGFASYTALASAAPRYARQNQEAMGTAYFDDFIDLYRAAARKPALPAQALCSMTYADYSAATTLVTNACQSCHHVPTTGIDAAGSNLWFGNNAAVSAYVWAPVPQSAAVSFTQSVLDAIVAVNGTNAAPWIMSHKDSSYSPVGYHLNNTTQPGTYGVANSSRSQRVGPYRYTRFNTYAGWSSVTAFLQAGGGTSTENKWVVPRTRNCTTFTPVATATKDAAGRASLMGLYGAPEATGSVAHPRFPAMSAADAALASRLLDGPIADGAVYMTGIPGYANGVYPFYMPVSM
jgi:hypothetical protein